MGGSLQEKHRRSNSGEVMSSTTFRRVRRRASSSIDAAVQSSKEEEKHQTLNVVVETLSAKGNDHPQSQDQLAQLPESALRAEWSPKYPAPKQIV